MLRGVLFRFLAKLLAAAFLFVPFGATALVSVDRSSPERMSEQLNAPRGLYPAAVALLSNVGGPDSQPFFCSATLVAPQWVLTAGNCVTNADDNVANMQVMYGDTDLLKGEKVNIKRIVVHPGYDRNASFPTANMALLELDHPLKLRPLALAEGTLARSRTTGKSAQAFDAAEAAKALLNEAVVAGWGSFFAEEPIDRLNLQRHLSVRILARNVCNDADHYDQNVKSDEICAQSAVEGIDACNGFSGAPLMIPENGEFRLQGIVSWGEGCALRNRPTVYTDVTYYRSWINGVVKPPEVQERHPVVEEPKDPYKEVTARSVPQLQGRIAGAAANLAPWGLFRYMVSLSLANRPPPLTHFCGGVLVAREWVLTAAHCVQSIAATPEKLQLKLDTELLDGDGVTATAQRIVIHDKFSVTPFGNYLNDVALIKIDAPNMRSDLKSSIHTRVVH